MDVSQLTEAWAQPAGPDIDVVVSSRVRHARNLDKVPFPPRADKEDLRRVAEAVERQLAGEVVLKDFTRVDVNALNAVERAFLKESNVISPEMELGGEYRLLYLNPKRKCVVMVNEEDHLRMYCVLSGFQLQAALEDINSVDEAFGRSLTYAFSDKYGYLTTCPSNVGTAMRASVMVHLPGLVMMRQVDDILKPVSKKGLTARGYYGENSEFLGDFYQVSNEVTLGKTEGEIIESLQSVVQNLIERERAARMNLFQKKLWYVEDVVWRAYALLTHARIMSSNEAFKLLSPIRLGIERGYFSSLSHYRLNQLVVAVQPAHIQMTAGAQSGTEERDLARARFLRNAFSSRDAGN
jgi:protein arginine kinase